MKQATRNIPQFRSITFGAVLLCILTAGCRKDDPPTDPPVDPGATDVSHHRESPDEIEEDRSQEPASGPQTGDECEPVVSDTGPETEPTPPPEEGATGGGVDDGDPVAGDRHDERGSREDVNRQKTPNARAAEEAANRLLSEAEQAAARGEMGEAFELAVNAWETTRPHEQDARCKAIGARALSFARQFGEASHRSDGGLDLRKPITVK